MDRRSYLAAVGALGGSLLAGCTEANPGGEDPGLLTPEPADVQLVRVGTGGQDYEAGETVVVEMTFVNFGEVADEQAYEVRVADDEVESDEIEIGGDDQETVAVAYPTEGMDTGTYTYEVAAGDVTTTGEFDLEGDG